MSAKDIELGICGEEDDEVDEQQSLLKPKECEVHIDMTYNNGDSSIQPAEPSTSTQVFIEDALTLNQAHSADTGHDQATSSSQNSPSDAVNIPAITYQSLTHEELLFQALVYEDYEEFDGIIKSGHIKDINFKPKNTSELIKTNNFLMEMPYLRAYSAFLFSCERSCTALHVAAAFVSEHCTKALLESGADPNICDKAGRTVLDVVGTGLSCIKSQNVPLPENSKTRFPNVIRMLHKKNGKMNTMKSQEHHQFLTTPIHAAVEVENMEAFERLTAVGANPDCFNYSGQTPFHLCVEAKFLDPFKFLINKPPWNKRFTEIIDLSKYRNGTTVLHVAVSNNWFPGVRSALELGADVTKGGGALAPIHSAAIRCDNDILREIINYASRHGSLDYKTGKGETALFLAVIHGHFDGVEAIINIEDRDYKITDNVEGLNMLHAAASKGYSKIINALCRTGQVRINALKGLSEAGFGPIHYAVSENHQDSVFILLNHDQTLVNGRHNLYGPITEKRDGPLDSNTGDGPVTIILKTSEDQSVEPTIAPSRKKSSRKAKVPVGSTPLHIAAMYNHDEIAKTLFTFDKMSKMIHEKNSLNELPLHTAIVHSSRDVIKIILNKRSSLASPLTGPNETSNTAIDLLINNLSDPTPFLEDVFDDYITMNTRNLEDPKCEVTIDYSLLVPEESKDDQMKVLQALLDTGNRYDQESLLGHPLVESFLHLKWNALLPFFYIVLALYAFFLVSLNMFSYSLFYFKDIEDSTKSESNIVSNTTDIINNATDTIINATYIVSNATNVVSNATNTTNNEYKKPRGFDTTIWTAIMYVFIGLICLQEPILNIKLRSFIIRKASDLRKLTIRKCFRSLIFGYYRLVSSATAFTVDRSVRVVRYMFHQLLIALKPVSIIRLVQQLFTVIADEVEVWTKWGSLGLACVLPFTTKMVETSDVQWPRDVATFALPMAWMQIMILISRFPGRGYYVLMFGRVTRNVIEILLTFSFVLIGFSISFGIQFQSLPPFDGPISAFFKTIVMMTSEFDYGSLFDEEHSEHLGPFQMTARILFIVFFVLASIVLMNLMVGVAVNDITQLETLGHIQRLKKQVEILVALESFAHNYPRLSNILTTQMGNIDKTIVLKPGKLKADNDKILHKKIQDNIFKVAQDKETKKSGVVDVHNSDGVHILTVINKQLAYTADEISGARSIIADLTKEIDSFKVQISTMAAEVTFFKQQNEALAEKVAAEVLRQMKTENQIYEDFKTPNSNNSDMDKQTGIRKRVNREKKE